MKAVAVLLLAALAVAHAGIIGAPIATQYTALVPPVGVAGLAGVAGVPGISLSLSHAPIALAAPAAIAVAPAGATYTAVNRGAVHTAPLPGHIIGSAQVNVQPAPGTI